MQLALILSRFYKPNIRTTLSQSVRRAFTVVSQKRAQDVSTEVSRTRNIGIIAHIDAVCRTSVVDSVRKLMI